MQSVEVVVAGSDQGESVGNPAMQWEQFGELELRASRSDWAKGPADFERSLRFHVKEVQVAGAAVVVDQDYGAGSGARALAGEEVSCRQGGERKTCRHPTPGTGDGSGSLSPRCFFHWSLFALPGRVYLVATR